MRVARRPDTNEAEWAWAAGLFEGEGSLVIDSGTRIRLQLRMTDEDVVRRFGAVVGGSIYGPYRYEQPDGHVRKRFWVWNTDGADAREIARRFEPWLGERRRARVAELGLLHQPSLLADE